jgi:hypothetical protein
MRAFVDSVHEGIARVLLGEDESLILEMPVSWLPEGVVEGKTLRVTWELDEEETKRSLQTIADLYDALEDHP